MKYTSIPTALMAVFIASCASTGTQTTQKDESKKSDADAKLMGSVQCFGSRQDVVLYGGSEYIIVVGTPNDNRVAERRSTKPTNAELNAHCPEPTLTPDTEVSVSKVDISAESVQVNEEYRVNIHYSANGDSFESTIIEKACIIWNQYAPKCFSLPERETVAESGYGLGLYNGEPGDYTLSMYLIYESNGVLFKTNKAAAELTVQP